MSIDILTYSTESIQPWSGGTTQELFIYPKTATAQDRNFDFRISTATVEVEESTFTNYQGYLRKLMVLEGELTILHENHYSIQLLPFEQDSFSGDWNSTSKGKVRDFNVIYKPHLSPWVEVKSFAFEEIDLVQVKALFLFILKGNCELNNEDIKSGTGVFCSDIESLKLSFKKECTLILVRFD